MGTYSASACRNNKCMCDSTDCASLDGVCVPHGQPAGNPACTVNTGTSCLFWGCGTNQWCGKGHRCMCKYPFSKDSSGQCVRWSAGRKPTCNADPGGSCRVYPCHTNRGPTRCVNERCLCQNGYCASDTRCVAAVGPWMELAE